MTIPERFLALGDSFTIGTGTTPDRSFPAVLAGLWTKLGRTVVLENPAVNGYATDDVIHDELPLVASFRPTLITLLIGANDIVRGSSEDRYRQLGAVRDGPTPHNARLVASPARLVVRKRAQTHAPTLTPAVVDNHKPGSI